MVSKVLNLVFMCGSCVLMLCGSRPAMTAEYVEMIIASSCNDCAICRNDNSQFQALSCSVSQTAPGNDLKVE